MKCYQDYFLRKTQDYKDLKVNPLVACKNSYLSFINLLLNIADDIFN